VRPAFLSLLLFAAACRHSPRRSELAAFLPANASIVGGFDIDALRNTALFPKLPENFREASYVMAALDPPNLVTAEIVRGNIRATAPPGPPPDLARHATAAPIWIVVRGTAQLPLQGNLSNINRLIEQTDYTVISIKLTDKAEFEAEGVCRSAEAAAHLDQNLRAIATLARFPLEVRSEGAKVHATGAAPLDRVLGLLR
jgi:hypothetical protein